MPTSDVTQRRFFHEPFSETDSWILRNETGKILKAGRYYLVGFSLEFASWSLLVLFDVIVKVLLTR